MVSPLEAILNEFMSEGRTRWTSERVIGYSMGPEVEERVPERVDAVVRRVDVSDGPVRRHLKIAGHEADADGVSRLNGPRLTR